MIEDVIDKIRTELIVTFNDVFGWFSVDEGLLKHLPVNKGWSIGQILEHISLTNYYLLILIRRASMKAIQKSKTEPYQKYIQDYELDENKLKSIGEHRSFEWNRPEHMEPSGIQSLQEIRSKMEMQLKECIECLHQLKNGEGVLYKTMMTVNGLGKMDVYHYIYFLGQHAKRHIGQMEKIKTTFEINK